MSPEPTRTPVADLERCLREELAAAEVPTFEELAALVDGDLSSVEREGLEALLEVDPGLAADFESLAALRAELAASGRLRESTQERGRRLPRRYLAAAATLAVALGGSWLATRGDRPERPPLPTAPAPLVVMQPGGAGSASSGTVVAPLESVFPSAQSAGLHGVPIPRLPAARPKGGRGGSGAGSFESGNLAGWAVTPAASLDFENGRISPSWSTPRT